MVWEQLLDTFIMIRDAFTWFVIISELYFLTLFTWMLFMFSYIFFVEIPGMIFNLATRYIELIFVRFKAKREGLVIPRSDADVHILAKKSDFIKMMRDIRILINKWALLIQNGTGILLFIFIWGTMLMFLIYAISQGVSIGQPTNGGNVLDMLLDLVDLLPYVMMFSLVVGFIWTCYTAIASVYTAFEYFVIRDSIWTERPYEEMVSLWNSRKNLKGD